MLKNERVFTLTYSGGALAGTAHLRIDGSLLVRPDRGSTFIVKGVAEAVLEEHAAYLAWRESQGGTPGKPPDGEEPLGPITDAEIAEATRIVGSPKIYTYTCLTCPGRQLREHCSPELQAKWNDDLKFDPDTKTLCAFAWDPYNTNGDCLAEK